MALTWPNKDPEETLDYELDWSDRLAEGDTIATSAWEITAGGDALVIDSDSNTDTTTTVWLSAGTLNKNYELTNTITTPGGRTHEQTVILKVRAK